jgi:hypothetical protein
MSTQQPDDIIRLATARTPFQAHAWEQALRDEGIVCKVVGDYLDAGFGNISGVLPEIWVHKDDLARAEKVLEGLEESAAESGTPNEEE